MGGGNYWVSRKTSDPYAAVFACAKCTPWPAPIGRYDCIGGELTTRRDGG